MGDKSLKMRNLLITLCGVALLLIMVSTGGLAKGGRSPAPPEPPDAPEEMDAPDALEPPEPPPARPWLGVYLSEEEDVVTITGMRDGGPAAKAGVKEGDRVVEVDGQVVHTAGDIRRALRDREPGDSVPMKIERDGKSKTLTVTLGKAPRPMWHGGPGMEGFGPGFGEGWGPMQFFSPGASRSYLGVRLQPMTEELRAYFKAPRGRGLLVSRVEEDTPAAKAGLRAGDVIIEVDGKGVADRGDISAALADHEPGDTVTVKVIRDGAEKSHQVEVAERPAPRPGRRSELRLPRFADRADDLMLEQYLTEASRQDVERAMETAREALEEAMESRLDVQREVEESLRQSELARADQALTAERIRDQVRQEIEQAIAAAEIAREHQPDIDRQIRDAMRQAEEELRRAQEELARAAAEGAEL
jgi:hypothetical protein